jgi:hypothetical protein
LQRIAGLETGLKSARETNIALMSAPPQQQYQAPVQQQPQRQEMPDPITDKDAYAARIRADILSELNTQNAQMSAHQAAQAQAAQRVDVLWETFEERYSDLAEDPALVEVAASKVIKEMGRRGVDTNKYMFQASDQFLEDVAKRMKADYGHVFEKGGTPSAPATGANRTAVFGGMDGSTIGAKPAEAPAGDMIADIQELQKKDGYL